MADISIQARAIVAQNPEIGVEMASGWNRVCDLIEKRALSCRPKPKSFEVRHECEVARKAFLTAIVEGRGVKIAEDESRLAVNLD